MGDRHLLCRGAGHVPRPSRPSATVFPEGAVTLPNVLLLMSDEHNPFISSVYGHPFVRTPNMERLARMGTVYENAYCPSPLCVPSRSAFMSGRRVHEIEAYNNCKVIGAKHPSYGSELAAQGVHTAYIGSAANLYRHPFELGFTEMQRVTPREPSLSTDFRRDPLPVRKSGALNKGFGPREDAWDSDMLHVDRAVQWLHETAPTLDVPWTVTVNVKPPHYPMYARPEFWEMYEGLGDLPKFGTKVESANHPYAQDLRAFFRTDECTEEEARRLRQGYYACVTYVDAELGRLLDALEATGQLHDTVVMYTTDHGEMLGKFGIWWKSSLYEDSVRIPMLAAGPGFGQGVRVETPVSLLDLQAAMFYAVGKRRPEAWAGEPLQALPRSDANRVVFSEYHAHGVRSGGFMVRRGDWKLMYNMAAPHQLFNLRHDPDELDNRWEAEPAVAQDLERELRAICNPEVVNERAHAFERRQLEVIAALTAQG